MKEIKFGTDGWRDVISDGFTFRNVKRAAQATCEVARKNSKSRMILVGYDNRFFSYEFAQTAAKVAVGNGFKVEFASHPVSSPVLSSQVRQRKAAIGIMITASHNPYYFNGYKLKGGHGGSVTDDIPKAIEDRLDVHPIQEEGKGIKFVDFSTPYLAMLKKMVRFPNLNALKGPVIFDALHGPGGLLFERLAGGNKKIHFIRKERDPLFGGVNPEPIETNLELLKETIRNQKASIGIAVDGDADRIGVIDENSRYLPPQTVMPLLLLHLIENKKMKGKVVQTVSMGYLPERIAKYYKLPFEVVPVGFKYVAQKMGEEKVLFGGEESGGYGVGLWSPERDGLLCALLLLEMLSMKKKTLSALVDEMYVRFGKSFFKRVDFRQYASFDQSAWVEHIKTILGQSIADAPIKSVLTMDGLKIITGDDSWFLMRPSGTEPLLRTYAEASTPQFLDSLITEAGRLALTQPPSAKKLAEEARRLKKKNLKKKK
ncbi:MAG: Phosphoglucomutase [Elusimicrobia bacterium]|nr:Phosphoglucomutase [Elusimicrobiota bacterium]